MHGLPKLVAALLSWIKGVAAGAAAVGSVGGVPYVVLGLLGGGLALTGGTAVWYTQTHQPLSEAPVVGRLPGMSAAPAAPPFLFAIYGLEKPMGIAVGPDGRRIYATDTAGDRVIHVLDRSGKEVGTLTPTGANPAQRRPTYLAVSPDGKLYASDLLRAEVDVFGPDGSYQGTLRPKGLETERWQPLALATDRAGNLYVTETTQGKHRVLVLDSEGNVKAQFGKEGSGSGELSFPNGLTVDEGKGLVYVSDSSNSRMQILDPQKGFIGGFRSPQGSSLPRGVAVSGNQLYVADTIGGNVTAFALEATPRFLYNFGSDGRGDGQFQFPEGLAVDSSGRIYVADRENNRIQVFGYQ